MGTLNLLTPIPNVILSIIISSMNPIVETYGLGKTYPDGTVALKGITFSVGEGEFVGIMGPSGSGKSTLLHLIGGLDRPTEGSVKVFNTRIDRLSEEELSNFRKGKIGYVFQFYYLLEDFNVFENIYLIGQLQGVKGLEERVYALLDSLRLSHRRDHKPYQLSGGEQQRVAIGRALVGEPRLILADEPTGNVDREESNRIFELFKRLNEEKGITFLVATHNRNSEDSLLRL
jgi:lipoprotein-releasing system ATP-binding protein